jgi:hypothetical protein
MIKFIEQVKEASNLEDKEDDLYAEYDPDDPDFRWEEHDGRFYTAGKLYVPEKLRNEAINIHHTTFEKHIRHRDTYN